MEKIKLKDGTIHEINPGASESSISIPVANSKQFKAVFDSFTDENLSQYEILTEADETCAIIKDKAVKSATLELVDGAYNAVVNLANIDKTAKQIKELQDSVDQLVLDSLGV